MRNYRKTVGAGRMLACFAAFFVTMALRSEAAAQTNAPATEPLYQVDERRGIAYYTGADADPKKHKLDLFTPRGKQQFSTVLFLHGGGWLFGDKGDLGIYAELARMLAERGVGCAVANYRLSPAVKHPEHIKDVARAFAWLHQHIEEYGGRPDRIFVSGHSAGGHLAALLGTDERYLIAENLYLGNVRGVIAVSGGYNVPEKIFKEVFGPDPAAHRDASPLAHVNARCPPFLLIYADQDFPTADHMAEEFCAALKNAGVPAQTLTVPDRGHLQIIMRASRPDDPCGRAILDFVRAREGEK